MNNAVHQYFVHIYHNGSLHAFRKIENNRLVP